MNPIVSRFLRSLWWQYLLVAVLFSYMAYETLFTLLFKNPWTNRYSQIYNAILIVTVSVAVLQLWFRFIRYHLWWHRAKKHNENPLLPKWIRRHSESELGIHQSDSQILIRVFFLGFIFLIVFFFGLHLLVTSGWKNIWLSFGPFIYTVVGCATLVQLSYSLWMEKHYREYEKKQSKRNIRYV